MSKKHRETSHTQCLLEKGTLRQVTWLPTKFAVVGKHVKLRKRGEPKVMSEGDPAVEGFEYSGWDDGWQVIGAWTTMGTDDVNERSRDFKTQREASDRPRDGQREKLRIK